MIPPAGEELLEHSLGRIAARDPQIRAWAHLEPEQTRAIAGPAGPLHGVPVGVKDIIDVAGLPCERGSPIYAGRRPDADAAVVATLRRAGAVIVGKTVTTEFALYTPGPTVNPLDPARTPGGSSSGSAAAVADAHVPLALGTQTAGSIVRPAAFCGVYGLKATYGGIDTTGTWQLSPSLDTLGLFARGLEDLQLGMSALAPPVRETPALLPRVGIVRTYEWDALEPSTRERFEGLCEGLAAAGVPTVDVELPRAFAELAATQQTIMNAEAALSLDQEHDAHGDQLSDRLRELIETGRAIPAVEYLRARERAELCRSQLRAVLAHTDVLLAPAALGEAPLGLEQTGDPLPCRIWTLLGTPALAVPWLRGPAGMPLGVQLLGRWGGDLALVEATRQIEARL